MNVTPSTTVQELLRGGFTLTSPEGFELRGRPDDSSIAMRQMTPRGMTAAGHLPLGDFGVHLACQEMTSHAEMVASEDAREAATATASQASTA